MHVLMDALLRLRVCMHMQCAENIVIASVHSVTQKLFCSLCLSVIWPKANRIFVIVQMKHLLDINKTDFLNIIYFKKHRNPLITSKTIALFCMQTMLISSISIACISHSCCSPDFLPHQADVFFRLMCVIGSV